MPLSTDKITLTAAELESHIAEEVQNRLAVESFIRNRPQLTTGEHLAIRAWLNDTLGSSHYRSDATIDKLLMLGVINETRVLELIEERRQTKGGATKYDKFFVVTVDEDEEGEDA